MAGSSNGPAVLADATLGRKAGAGLPLDMAMSHRRIMAREDVPE
ncbi:hypothetical protein [Aliiruegeria haliotis]|nr:hypothetical protein [Aliiruegeria haliotis]